MLHLVSYHCEHLRAGLCFGDMEFLEDNEVGRKCNNSFLILHIVSLELVVDDVC